MGTQAIKFNMMSPSFSLSFEGTETDDQWNALPDSVNGLNLYEVMQGVTITHMNGYYTAGGAMVRVRNTQTNKVKLLEALHMVGGQRPFPVKPFKVEMYDVLEVFPTVAGS